MQWLLKLLYLPKGVIELNAVACGGELNYVDDDDSGYLNFDIDMSLSLMSSLALGFVALIILTDSRIQGHPNKIIAYTCLIDAYNFYNFFTRYVVCGYDLSAFFDRMFANTVQDPFYYVKCNWFH
jgi:hypothetical protein